MLLYAELAKRSSTKPLPGRENDVVKTLVEIAPFARRIQDSTLLSGKCKTQDPTLDYRLQSFSPERRLMVTLGEARKVIAAAEQKAVEIKQPMNIAVVDEGGNLVSHARMDGAWIGSIDISINKAFTSRAFDISTKDLAQYSQSGGQFFGIHVSNHGRVMIFAGGIPLKRAGKVVGAVGVSGGSGEQDQAVAEAGAKAF
jgi:uncharacterized protein GlcG (DUF336 family)